MLLEFQEIFEDLYNVDTQEQVAIRMCDFDGARRVNYFGGEPIGRAEVEVRVGKLKNRKTAGKDEINGKDDKWWRYMGGGLDLEAM